MNRRWFIERITDRRPKGRRIRHAGLCLVTALICTAWTGAAGSISALAEETPAVADVAESEPGENGDGGAENSSLTAEINGNTKTFRVKIGARAVAANWHEKVELEGWTEEKLRTTPVKLPDGTDSPDQMMLEGGNGNDEAKRYILNSVEALAWFGYMVNNDNDNYRAKYALLNTDVDLSGGDIDNPVLWIPIKPYYGVFDGGNKSIANMYIEDWRLDPDGSACREAIQGLFGTVYKEVRNVRIASGEIRGGRHSGGITGDLYEGGIIRNCSNNANITTEGTYIGGIAGFSGEKVTFINCYNTGNITATVSVVGGITSYCGKSNCRYENCYNTGKLIGSKVGVLWADGTNGQVVNCFYDRETSGTSTGKGARSMTTAQMQSWAAAYALNGRNMEGPWQYKEGGYPSIIGSERLVKAPGWNAISQGMQDGLISSTTMEKDSSTGAYLIKSADQFCQFASLVNNGNTGIQGQLSIDMNMAGEKYGGSEADPLLWEPIGTAGNIFQGTFDGKGKVLGSLSVNKTGYAGLFGCAGGGAVIRNLGLDSSCRVVSAGAADGVDGTAGFVGAVLSVPGKTDNITIENCYNRASVKGTSSQTGAFVGAYGGEASGTHVISHCYTAGAITSSSGTPGAIAGSFADYSASTGGIQRCYWDGGSNPDTALKAVGGGVGTATDSYSGAKTTTYMKSGSGSDTSNILVDLNTGNTDGVWSHTAGRNNDYPIFTVRLAAMDWGTVGASVFAPPCQNNSSTGTAGTSANPYQIWTAEDLAWIADQINNKGRTDICAKVMADINLFGGLYTGTANDSSVTAAQALPWIPIGSDSGGTGYTGTFDGNGYTITMMYARGTEKLGLFGTLGSGANVKSVVLADNRLEATDNTAGARYAGGIAGYVKGDNASITGCRNAGRLELPEAGSYFGGTAGYITGTGNKVTSCENAGTITGTGDYLGNHRRH